MKMPMHFVLDEQGEARPEVNFRRWMQWRLQADMRIALDQVGRYVVSTVFLGYATGFSRPMLFETMVWVNDASEVDGRRFVGQAWRYADRAHALLGHAEALRRIAEVMAGQRSEDDWDAGITALPYL